MPERVSHSQGNASVNRNDGARPGLAMQQARVLKRDSSAGQPREWQAVGICEISNFTVLRRQIGLPHINELLRLLSERIAGLGYGDAASAGRGTIAFSFAEAAFADVAVAAASVLRICQGSLDLDEKACQPCIAVGVAATPHAELEEVRLIEEAEGALEDARAGDGLSVRDLSLDAPAFDRLALMQDLPTAIANGEMFLQYQPKVHVRRQEISSCEALVRWNHPIRGLIVPGDFITVAEDCGQIAALTLWTLDRVIEDQALVHGDGHNLRFFINISGQLLSDDAFVAAVCERMDQCDALIGFEITETAVIEDPLSAIANLNTFAAAGVDIAIDDYGAGLSSLAYLKQLPAKELKIDKLFILNLTSSNRDPLIVRSTIDLAHALDMEVTAEGVESPAALALLSVMGCDMVQGYLISRPVSLDLFRQFLRDYSADSWRESCRGTFAQPASFWKRA
jgi:EAL domain-containing protein (putative c-di-GMP-specific phosphodiesterase class I)